MARADEILNEALTLGDAERAEVALRLLDSIDPPDPLAELGDEAWRAELARRAERAAAGESRGTSWDEVRERLERRLAE